MRIVLFAFLIGCGGTIAGGGDDASTKDAASDAPIPDAGFKSSLSFDGHGQGTFFGSFYANAQQASAGCQLTSVGSCTVSSCSATAPQTPPNAGTLTLTVNGSPVATATPQGGSGDYMTTPLPFSPGDVLGVSASGADVPAFATHTITSPGKLAVGTPSTITTSQDLTLTWTGGESGAIVIVGIGRGGFNGATSVSCSFDATSGTGTVPKEQLASLQNGAPTGSLIVGQQRSTTFVSGTFVIDLDAIEDDQSSVTFQ